VLPLSDVVDSPASFAHSKPPQGFNFYTLQLLSMQSASPGVSSSLSTSFVPSEESSVPFSLIMRSSTPYTGRRRGHGNNLCDDLLNGRRQHRLAPFLILEQKLITLLSDEEDSERREATRPATTWSASSSSPFSIHGPKAPPDLSGSLSEHTFAFKTAEFRGFAGKVCLAAPTPITISELGGRIYNVDGSGNQRHAWAPLVRLPSPIAMPTYRISQ
jgi:hypothetical protein